MSSPEASGDCGCKSLHRAAEMPPVPPRELAVLRFTGRWSEAEARV
jgi:hypothetical protein